MSIRVWKYQEQVGTLKREVSHGSSLKLLKPLQEGLIQFPVYKYGRIVSAMDDFVEAYFRLDYEDPIKSVLRTEKDGMFSALLLRVPLDHFAVYYSDEQHGHLLIPQDAAKTIPFVDVHDLPCVTQKEGRSWFPLKESTTYHLLSDLKNQVQDTFKVWVHQNVRFTRILPERKHQRLSYEECVVEEDMEKLWAKKYEIEHVFAQATKVYVEFKADLHVYRDMVVKLVEPWTAYYPSFELKRRVKNE